MACCQSSQYGGAHTCTCGCCEALERVRYFPRQLLTADDMRAEQEYFRAKMRRHNRMLFGRGVACGLQVQPSDPNAKDSTLLTICPGYALSPMGDDIELCEPFEFDLERCVKPRVPECPPAAVTKLNALTYEKDVESEVREFFIAIRPVDCPTRPVRTLPEGCACDDSACEFSRIREGFEVKCLDALPASHAVLCPTQNDKEPVGAASEVKGMGVERGVAGLVATMLHASGAGGSEDTPDSADDGMPHGNKSASGCADIKGAYQPKLEVGNPMARILESLLGACPPCPQDNWVVLAALRWQPGASLQIENSVRRRVVNLSTLVERLGCFKG